MQRLPKNKKKIELETTNIDKLRQLFASLKEILQEVNIRITNKISDNEEIIKKNGIYIVTMDTKTVALFHVSIMASSFSKFITDEEEIIFGVNVGQFYDVLQNMNSDSDSPLVIIMTDKNTDELTFIRKHGKNNRITGCLKLLTLKMEKPKFSPQKYVAAISIKSSEFQTLCKKTNNISETLCIDCTESNVVFSICDGENSVKYEYKYENDDDIMTIQFSTEGLNNVKYIRGTYQIKYLVAFQKCATLCNHIQLNITNVESLLVVLYEAIDFCRIYLILPNNDLEEKNYESTRIPYSESSDEDQEDDEKVKNDSIDQSEYSDDDVTPDE